jgi:hypothetical protein
MVLVEEGTNTSCGPCASQNPKFKAWYEANSDRVIPVIYHAWWPGSNDPMYVYNTVMQKGRISTYYKMDTAGVPNCRVNGHTATPSSGWYDGAPGDTAALTAKLASIGVTSPISIAIDFQNFGANGSVKVTVSSETAISSKKLRIVITEKFHHYDKPGTNGEEDFENVARTMLPDHNGTTFSLAANGSKEYNFTFTLTSEVNPELYAIAFVQDDQTQEVLQAASLFKAPLYQFTSNSPAKFDAASEENPFIKTFSFRNNSSEAGTFTFSIEKTARTPADWTAEIENGGEKVVQPNEAFDMNLILKPGTTLGIGDAKIKVTKSDDPEFIISSELVTAISDNLESIQVLDGESNNSISGIAKLYKANPDYLEISGDNFINVGAKLTKLKYMIWNTSATGSLTAAKAQAITDAVNNNVGMLICGGRVVQDLRSFNSLNYFNVDYLGWNTEGFGSSPWKVWLTGVPGDPITDILGVNFEGNLINWLLPVLKIVAPETTYPIMHFQNAGRYVNINNTKDTVAVGATETIFAVRINNPEARMVFLGFNPFVVRNVVKRENLIKNSLLWIETGVTAVEESDAEGKVGISIAPNPASGLAKIRFSVSAAGAENIKLLISDSIGEEIKSLNIGTFPPGEWEYDLNTSALSQGMYFVNLKVNDKEFTQRLAIIR